MKIAVGDQYSHYYDVYLDGERLNNCVFADEEEGIAKVNQHYYKPEGIVVPASSTVMNTLELHGKVELKWIGPGNGPNRNFQVL